MDDRPIILNKDPKERQIYVGNANYRFDNKKYTIGGAISTTLFGVSLVMFGIAVYASYQAHGEGGVIIGAAGFMGFLVTLAGLIIGIMSFREEDKHYMLSRIGVFSNFGLLLIWGCIYLIGI